MPILVGFAEGGLDLRLKIFALLVCFLAQSVAWTKTLIVRCLNEVVLEQLVLLPRHCTRSERHERLYA